MTDYMNLRGVEEDEMRMRDAHMIALMLSEIAINKAHVAGVNVEDVVIAMVDSAIDKIKE